MLKSIFKLGLTGLLFGLIFHYVDISSLGAQLFSTPTWVIIYVLGIIAGQLLLAAGRMVVILGLFEFRLSFIRAFRINLIGGFFGQILVTFVSGDVLRVWLINRFGLPRRAAAEAILLDRLVGLVVLLMMMLCCLPLLLDVVVDSTMRLGLLMLGLIGFVGVAAFFGFGLLQRRANFLASLPFGLGKLGIMTVLANLLTVGRHLLKPTPITVFIGATSLFINVLNVLIFFVILRGMDVNISFGSCLLIVPFVVLVSFLPISVAGWGVREGAMVAGFRLFAVPAETTLAASVLFGLISLISVLPGGICWILDQVSTQNTTNTR